MTYEAIDGPMQVVEFEPSHARSGILIVGFPTHGLIGGVAASYLIESLDMRRVGGIQDPRLPPTIQVEKGFGSSMVGLYVHEGPCGIDGDCERLYVLKSDLVFDPALYHDVAEAVMTWVKDRGLELVVGLEGVKNDHFDATDVAAFAGRAGQGALDALAATRADDLQFTGFGAALVLESNRVHIPTVTLLTRANPEVPDAAAAARLVEVVDRIVPGIELEPGQLAKRAEVIEQRMRHTQEERREEMEHLQQQPHVSYMYG